MPNPPLQKVVGRRKMSIPKGSIIVSVCGLKFRILNGRIPQKDILTQMKL